MKKISTKNFRDVEDRLAERGITVSHETVRPWVNQSALGLMFAGIGIPLALQKVPPNAWYVGLGPGGSKRQIPSTLTPACNT
jgi:hypothetical protein